MSHLSVTRRRLEESRSVGDHRRSMKSFFEGDRSRHVPSRRVALVVQDWTLGAVPLLEAKLLQSWCLRLAGT